MYDWDFIWVIDRLPILFRGVIGTLQLTASSFVIGLLLALVLFAFRVSTRRLLSWPSAVIIELGRDLPVLVTMVWLYFCLPQLLSIAVVSPFWIATASLSINFAALQAEIVRSGYESIPRVQIEMAASLGFSPLQRLFLIIAPQAFWRSLPATLGQVVNTLKLSSLASFVTVGELFYTTSSLIQETFRPLEFYSAMGILYLIVILPIAGLVHVTQSQLRKMIDD